MAISQRTKNLFFLTLSLFTGLSAASCGSGSDEGSELPDVEQDRAASRVGDAGGLPSESASPREASAPATSVTVALVAVEKEAYTSYELGSEALDAGARVLLFPEWGFYEQPDTAADVVNAWRVMADERDAWIALGLRHDGRNAVALFSPSGDLRYAYRRDGHNSPPPADPELMRPTVVSTPFGRLGILFCDEARNRAFLDEIYRVGIDKLLVPNWVGQYASAELLLKTSKGLGYSVDVFNTDVAAPYGGRTHVYRSSEQALEFNAFGVNQEPSSTDGYKRTARGLRYVVSYHSL